jgi:hypothetical protein
VVALLSVAATLCPSFEDNFTQRIALAVICLASTAELWMHAHNGVSHNPRSLLIAGFALYAIGSAVKTWRYARFKS